MESPFPFESMILFSFLSIMLLIGVLLRAKISFLQKMLFPSCLIGGVLGLALVNTGLLPVSPESLETFAYHFFNISFISVGLTHDGEKRRDRGKEFIKGPAWMALVQGITFPLQAVLGCLFVLLFGILGLKLFPTFGLLVPLGFNEGPGQALSMGKVWEGIGFEHGATIGLTFAAIGYFFAFFVGVPLVNRGIRKGHAAFGKKELPRDFLTGIVSRDGKREPAGELTLHSASTDTLAFQAAMVGLVYLLTYGFVLALGSLFAPDVGKILWGFFFFFGLGISLLVRWIMEKLGAAHLLDSGIQRRITGWSVDFLIVSTVAAIKMMIVRQYMIPILVIGLNSGLLTTLAVAYLGKRTSAYNLERTVAIYGTVTGTVSCGLLLLRIADPEFKTPVALEIAIMNVFALPVVGGCTVLVNGPIWWNWSLGLTILVFASVMAAAVLLIRILRLGGASKVLKNEE